ncbi:hypothetical protein TWF718_002929 [Orbilia javanica]|uniref:Uncharacterized protein n=1 Tax=Orbilia javanica TaxID=47235 RepID=A0AAN8MT70_9PEZI
MALLKAEEPQTTTETRTVTGTAALAIYKTIIVGDTPKTTLTEVAPYTTKTISKTVYVVAEPTSQDTVTVSTKIPDSGASTVTKTITTNGNVKTVYVVYIAGRPIRTETPTTTKTIYKTIGGGGPKIKIIYVVLPNGTTKTITKTLSPETVVMTKTVRKGGKDVVTVVTITTVEGPAPIGGSDEEEDVSYIR